MPEHHYNIAVVGKTGVGKSSFINYLFQTRLAQTGVGRPVTARGFHPLDFTLNDLPVRIYDSWGLEADKAEEWAQDLDAELGSRDTDSNASQWFHTVFYCIGAGGHRVEPFDARIIKMFLARQYKVIIILTKADQANKEQITQMTEVIHQDADSKVPVIPVCSEEKQLYGGQKITPYGRTEVFHQIASDFWDSICLRLPARCISVLNQRVDQWHREQMRTLTEARLDFPGNSQLKLKAALQKFDAEIQNGLFEQIVINELRSTFLMYKSFGDILIQFPEGRKVRALTAFPDDKGRIFHLIPSIIARQILVITALAELVANLLGNTLQVKVKEALNDYHRKIKAEIVKLEPEIAKALSELKQKHIR